MRQAEDRVRRAQAGLAARRADEPLSAHSRPAHALEHDAQRHVGRQTMAPLVRIGQAPGAVAIIGRHARHLALQRLQRRRRRFQVDEPQLH